MYEYRESVPGRGRQWLATAAAFVLVLVSVTGLTLWQSRDLQVYSVQTGSMKPSLQPGDAVMVRRVSPDTLVPGDIVSFRSPADPGITITHRVVGLDPDDGKVITKGDGNRSADVPVAVADIAGRVERRFANAGYLIDGMRSTAGLALGVYLPAVVLTAGELRRLVRYFRPAYCHPLLHS